MSETTEFNGDGANNGIIVFPDFEKLKEEVETYRIELSILFLEHDELQ